MDGNSDDKTFFGVGQKATLQWLARLVEAFDERNGEGNLELNLKAEMTVGKKPVEAILGMCEAAKKRGVEAGGFLQCALEQRRYLAVEPAVDGNVFPPFIRLVARRSVIENLDVGPGFWEALSPTQLSDGDSTLSMQAIAEMQQDLIANKIKSLQEKRDTFMEQIWIMFADCTHFVDAGLAKNDQELIMVVARVVRCLATASNTIWGFKVSVRMLGRFVCLPACMYTLLNFRFVGWLEPLVGRMRCFFFWLRLCMRVPI